MLIIGIKEISPLEKGEIIEASSVFSPFYREYILSPVKEKDGRMQLSHSAQRLATVQMLHGFCKQRFAKMPNFAKTGDGKPCFEGECDVHFSFSHSGEVAVCALSLPDDVELDVKMPISDGAEEIRLTACAEKACAVVLPCSAGECVGVDVQVVESSESALSYNHEKIGERFFDESRYARMKATPTEENFIRLWTELESLSKMTGEGIGSYDKKTKEGAKTKTLCCLDSKNKRYYISVAYR